MTIEPYKKKRILGIFRGFPGLGRVVAGVSLLETLRDKYDYEIKFISYLQGNKYLRNRGYTHLKEVTPMDYCSIGLLPTNKMGVYIHNTIKEFMPDVIAIDGEPLILQSIKISYPEQHVVTLLNPADVYNPNNDKEAMDFFNALYSLSDLAIVHGLRKIKRDYRYKNIISINTIIRHEIIKIKNIPTNNIYCLLGGGTVNVDQQFEESTLTIGRLSQKVAIFLPEYTIHIVCSSPNIFKILKDNNCSNNVLLHKNIISAKKYYSDACLIITRSGRNTLSELAYLGIPAISFVSGCSYRKVEQTNNIKDINIPTITLVPKDVKVDTLAKICHKLISKKTSISLLPGNDEAIQSILDVKKNMRRVINIHLLPLIGAIAGDIIGSPYELKGHRIKRTDFPLFNRDSTFTDDTILTLAVAQWIQNRNGNLVEILHTLGNKYINVGFGHAFKCWLRSKNPKPYNSWGNGAAMRVSSIGASCRYLNEVLDLAEQTASITHNHPEGIKGAQAVAVSIYLAYRGFSKTNIKDYIENTFGYNLSRTIEEIRDGYSFDPSCQGSVPEAIVAFLESTNFEDAIRLAISLGGDADTQASISGAIAGAFYKEISIDIIEMVIKKLPTELLDILRSFNEFAPPKEISLAVTTKKPAKLMCKVQYTFAVACTNIIEVTIPQGTRLVLTSIPMSDINSNEECATFHINTNKEAIFALVEYEARLKYPEFLEEYDYLVERIMLFSKISDLCDFEISPLTEDDFLE